MALEKEIWLPNIVEDFFPANTFLNKAQNLSTFVDNRTVHIPNAGAAPNVVKNRTVKPATVGNRTDTDLTMTIDEYTTDPLLIGNKEKVELSYDKRASVLRTTKAALLNTYSEDILFNWLTDKGTTITTTGGAVPAHTPSATGTRAGVSRQDVLNIAKQFNIDGVPDLERYLLLDAVMYSELLSDLSEADKLMLAGTADAVNGIVGRLYGINVMMRNRVGVAATGGALKAWLAAGAAGDNAVALAWHANSVAVAQGDVKMFTSEDDPLYYGDILSFLARVGGDCARADKKGIIALVQAQAA